MGAISTQGKSFARPWYSTLKDVNSMLLKTPNRHSPRYLDSASTVVHREAGTRRHLLRKPPVRWARTPFRRRPTRRLQSAAGPEASSSARRRSFRDKFGSRSLEMLEAAKNSSASNSAKPIKAGRPVSGRPAFCRSTPIANAFRFRDSEYQNVWVRPT